MNRPALAKFATVEEWKIATSKWKDNRIKQLESENDNLKDKLIELLDTALDYMDYDAEMEFTNSDAIQDIIAKVEECRGEVVE